MSRFILSKSKVLEQYNILKKLSDEVAYSWKTNNEVGKVLEENTDCSFAAHSIESLSLIKDKRRVWFFGQGWDFKELELLFNKGLRKFVIDNETDLKLFLDFIKDKDIKVDLALRMKLKENTIHTGKHYVFGMNAKQVNYWIKDLRENRKINKLGIHFHRKTQNVSEWDLRFELEEILEKEVINKSDFLNIGGGIPWRYKNYNVDVLDNIFDRIKEIRKWFNGKLIIEPGRFIAAPSVKLEAEIRAIDGRNIILDCSVFNGAMDTFLLNIRLKVEGELENGKEYTIKGKTPDSLDIFRYSVFLNKPRIGEKIVFLDAGAYNFKSDFCNLEKIETVVTD